MKISIEIPDAEIRQSFATIMKYMEPSESENKKFQSKLKEYLEKGEISFNIDIMEREDREKLKYGLGMMALGKMMKED
jgi:sortase (surface protein transpeptidase)